VSQKYQCFQIVPPANQDIRPDLPNNIVLKLPHHAQGHLQSFSFASITIIRSNFM